MPTEIYSVINEDKFTHEFREISKKIKEESIWFIHGATEFEKYIKSKYNIVISAKDENDKVLVYEFEFCSIRDYLISHHLC